MSVCVGGLSLNMEIALNNWINSLNTTSSLDIRVAPATRTRGEGGRRPPSPLVISINLKSSEKNTKALFLALLCTVCNLEGIPCRVAAIFFARTRW